MNLERDESADASTYNASQGLQGCQDQQHKFIKVLELAKNVWKIDILSFHKI